MKGPVPVDPASQVLRRLGIATVFLIVAIPQCCAGLQTDFESSWESRRNVARFARCHFKSVKIRRANTMGRDYDLPEEDLTVEEESEWYVDLKSRRFRFEGSKFVSKPQAIEQMRFVSLVEKGRSRIFTVPNDGVPVPASTPTVMEASAEHQPNDALLSPVMWALGYLDLDQFRKEQVLRHKGTIKTVSGALAKVVHRLSPEGPVLITTVDASQDFAVTSLTFAASEDFEPGQELETYTVTSEKFDQGGYQLVGKRSQSRNL